MYKAVQTIGDLFYPEATCMEPGCDFDREPSEAARSQAKDHTIQTGHRTRVITRRVDYYVRAGAA